MTLVRCVIRVRSPVHVHAIGRFKCFTANVTNVGSFSRVNRSVIVSRVFRRKRSPAIFATVPFDFIVNFSHVTRNVFFLNETFTAYVTHVRPVTQMIFHVSRISLLRDESFIAQIAYYPIFFRRLIIVEPI